MHKTGSALNLSASDLSQFMACQHATMLDLQVANGEIKKPIPYPNATLNTLIQKGEDFEKAYVEELRRQGLNVAVIERGNNKLALQRTHEAMKAGADVIYQARLEQDIWQGWSDFLFRCDKPSDLGSWSYEVEDTKFAKHTRAGAILQITLYSQMLTTVQGVQPEFMYMHTHEGRQTYCVNDYKSYTKLVQKNLLASINQGPGFTYPEPVEHCEICKWWPVCNTQRRNDDHLTFIAGMGTSQIREVKKWGIATLQNMATVPFPVPYRPTRGNIETYNKLREQARLQLESRLQKKYLYEMLSPDDEVGLSRLPEPDEGDVFFDFEGDPFVGSTGREYLFGWIHKNEYHALWATTDDEELDAFKKFMHKMMQIRESNPGMHIYHFSQYEPAALKRLMGKYGTLEDEVDTLLRNGVFVDLHMVTKHALRAGIESYSLKELEKLHNFHRMRELKMVAQYKALLETMLENGNIDAVDEETRSIVQDYNQDDCASTLSLRNWLEQLRAEEINKGANIPRPELKVEETPENVSARQQRIKPIFEALMKDLPLTREERNEEQQAQWLLAHMLDWYWREDKAYWWNHYRLRDLPDSDLLEEPEAIAGLQFTGRTEKIKQSEVRYYQFPDQDYDLGEGDKVDYDGKSVGTISHLDQSHRVVGIKRKQEPGAPHPTHVICNDYIDPSSKAEAIFRIGHWVSLNGVDADGEVRAGRDLLMRKPPRYKGDVVISDNAQQQAVNSVLQLERGVLPVQGPPGSGKSYTAARMIIELIKQGKKIGITALSHKVITALLQKVYDAARKNGMPIKIVQKIRELSGVNRPADWIETKKNPDVLASLHKGANVAAGTSFMWAGADFFEAVDVLFVDEAGQLALIDTLAVAHAARSMVLLGDPQQLQQPQQGSHPEGTEVSALHHLIGEHGTIPPDRGIFLDKTWRLHPAICGYISELFYESRLQPRPENANQRIEGSRKYDKPGIYVERVLHEGNSNESEEEVASVKQIVRDLLDNEVYFINSDKVKVRLDNSCIKIISPYNAQVNAISKEIPQVQAGTVDKFQGQEAPVVIFSMATSSPHDAPRGMEFLYSLNRLNVAVSRARAVFILVASPALFAPECRSPRQIKLANALCHLVDVAHPNAV